MIYKFDMLIDKHNFASARIDWSNHKSSLILIEKVKFILFDVSICGYGITWMWFELFAD